MKWHLLSRGGLYREDEYLRISSPKVGSRQNGWGEGTSCDP